jgi:hypothetical protein
MAVDETRILHKYKKRLENELAPGAFGFQEDITYSQAYRQFKKEQSTKAHTIFEKLCALSEKTLKINGNP